LAGDLATVVEGAGDGPIILVGHSIGAMIIQTYCRLFPSLLGPRVGGIVLFHTTYTNPLRTAVGARIWQAIERPILVPLNYLTIWLAPLAWLANWQSYLNGSLHATSRLTSFSGNQTWEQLDYSSWLAARAWPAVLARGNLAMLNFDEQATLSKIAVPTLVVAGNHDRITKPCASDYIEQRLSNGKLANVPGGHLGIWECHSDVTRLLHNFAAKLEITQGMVERV
jgi:pimeloyl-ACP methyl ester carboxylesterase